MLGGYAVARNKHQSKQPMRTQRLTLRKRNSSTPATAKPNANTRPEMNTNDWVVPYCSDQNI